MSAVKMINNISELSLVILNCQIYNKWAWGLVHTHSFHYSQHVKLVPSALLNAYYIQPALQSQFIDYVQQMGGGASTASCYCCLKTTGSS